MLGKFIMKVKVLSELNDKSPEIEETIQLINELTDFGDSLGPFEVTGCLVSSCREDQHCPVEDTMSFLLPRQLG